ncbi:XRE family transcriptional regulator [Dyadobacter sp.]|uniref:XRE family transcriptional regulator n=1 Tax=Dyadobacter sp. TaxID=1914288 RepID=UPI003F70CB11
MSKAINQEVTAEKAARFAQLRKELNLNQGQFAARIGSSQGNVNKYESGKRPIGPNVEYRILHELNVNPDWWQTGKGPVLNENSNAKNLKQADSETVQYATLSYISTKARASFVELGHINEEQETYQILKSSPEENYVNQVIIEIEGDSMEPYLWNGCKVRCKEVMAGDWMYLNSGVYAVVYGNFFVVKRVKNSPEDGKIVLHSDNNQTGGSIEVPLSNVRKIWRVLRIVDAPLR